MTRKRLLKLLMGLGWRRDAAQHVIIGAHIFGLSYAEYWEMISGIPRRQGR